MHSQCASDVCLPDGSCGQSNDVAYVDAQMGSGDACTREVPCSLLSTALTKNRAYIKLTGVLEENVTIRGFVTILADPGTQLRAQNPGPVVKIAEQSSVFIYDLEITGAKKGGGLDGDGISVPVTTSAQVNLRRVKITRNAFRGLYVYDGTVNITESTISNNDLGFQTARGSATVSDSNFSDNLREGLWASGSGTVTVTRSTFRNNKYGLSAGGDQQAPGRLHVTRSTVVGNREGGIALLPASTNVVIANNFIVRNGGLGATFGGIWGFPASGSEIKFNTIADNTAAPTAAAGGIDCKAAVGVTNNLIVRNTGGPSNPQLAGLCNNAGSFVSSSGSNVPGFVQPNTEPYDYHLSASTPDTIRDGADCGGINEDFDGETRPASGRCDLGADEYKTP